MLTKTLAIGAATAAIACPLTLAAPMSPALPVQAIEIVEIPRLDFAAIDAEDHRRLAEGEPYRYAMPHPVTVSPANAGTWERLDDRTLMWRLRVMSTDATSINLAFERFELPATALLSIATTNGDVAIRPFTADDNNIHRQLWTPPVPGDDVVIELQIDDKDRNFVEESLMLTSVNVGYRGFYDVAAAPSRSGSCNYDVACSEADEWRDEIPCVAAISTGGSLFCTGFMVNNVRQDGTPLFMTANHCGVNSGNAPSLVAYWNYEDDFSDPLDCPGSSSENGSLDQFTSGSTFRASGADSDFTIVEFNSAPDEAYGVAYCGWDARDQITDCSVAIHHPNTDNKRWSIDYDASEIYGYNTPGTTHLRIIDWDLGTTEPGSSGSPLFDCTTHRVVGQLHGGYAACGNDLEDWYGRISVSWNAGLSDVLDPDGTGTLFVDTLGKGLSLDPAVDVLHYGEVGGPFTEDSIDYTLTNNTPDPVQFRVSTGGSYVLNTNGNTFPVNGTLDPDGGEVVVTVSLGSTTSGLAAGVYTNTLVIEDVTNGNARELVHTLEIGQTNFSTTPENDFIAGGPLGGPFPGTQAYELTSLRPSDMTVQVTSDVDWISINGSDSASILFENEGQSSTVVIGFSAAAADLPNGIVTGTVTFDNLEGDAGDTTRQVTLDVGRFTYAAVDTPIAINDNSTLTSDIVVNDGYCMGDVDVVMDISHTYIGDLIVDLTSPEGTTVRLHDRTGGSSSDIVTTYDDDGDGTNPDGPGTLADFDGELVSGTWTLTISDNAGADTGALNNWSLKIASTGETCPPAAFDQSVYTDVDADLDIVLEAASPEGGSLSYTITSLPNNGILTHPTLGQLNSAPVTLPFFSDTVNYSPDSGYLGSDLFTFRASDGIDSNEAAVSIQVGSIPNPDECSGAAVVGNGVWDFDTTGASTDGPGHGDACQFDGQTYQDIWYRYVACGDGELIVATCEDLGGSADYDTDLVVYDGTNCGDLQLLACNDDSDLPCGSFEGGYKSSISVNVVDGNEYLIRVGGFADGNVGTGTLLVDGPTGVCGEVCEGDFNESGVVNVDDLLFVISNWNAPFTVDDLLLVIANWNSNCP
tara:strand:- start:3595 stop:6864 length:3270 start_codon:yes stop_codon:yes gene_type:complete